MDETFAYYEAAALSYCGDWPNPLTPLSLHDERYVGDRLSIDNAVEQMVRGRILDLGCGGGRNIPHYAGQVDWIGLVDQSIAMLSLARTAALHHLPASRIETVCAELPGWVPPTDLSVDTVLCSFLFSHLADEQIDEIVTTFLPCLSATGSMLVVDALWHENASTSKAHVLEMIPRTLGVERPHMIRKRYFSPQLLYGLLSQSAIVSECFSGDYFFVWRLSAPKDDAAKPS